MKIDPLITLRGVISCLSINGGKQASKRSCSVFKLEQKTGNFPQSKYFYSWLLDKIFILFIMYRILILSWQECCESHSSLSPNRLIQTHRETHLLTTVINNQMNSILSMLQWIHLKHMFWGRRPLLEPCRCRERFSRPCLFGFVNCRHQNLSMAVK